MRSLFALVLLIALGASASAATVHHARARHHVVVRHSPVFAVPPVRYDDTPSYNDPSKFGGGAP